MKHKLQAAIARLSLIVDANWDDTEWARHQVKQALTALSELEATAVNPVAWMYRWKGRTTSEQVTRARWPESDLWIEVPLYEAAPVAQQPQALTRDCIREIFMAHGFTIKEGQTDLKPYVYEAAAALLNAAQQPQAEAVPIDWSQAGPLMDAAASANLAGFTAGTTNWAAHVYRQMLKTAPQQAEAVPVGQIAQSDKDFESFWRTINAKGLTKRNIARVAWRISHQKTKQRISQMNTISQAFDGSDAENLTVLDVRDKGFLRDLAAHAVEARESVVPAWADAYTRLADAAEGLAQMIERTEVQQ